MELVGKVWKDGKFWLVEVPLLNVCTQGHTRKNALFMIEDAISELLTSYFAPTALQELQITVRDYGKDSIGVSASDSNILLSFLLIRQRELSRSTVREVAERLGSRSPNSYAQYERGKMRVTLNQYERLLHAVNPEKPATLRLI